MKKEIVRKAGFSMVTVLVIAAMLLAGCGTNNVQAPGTNEAETQTQASGTVQQSNAEILNCRYVTPGSGYRDSDYMEGVISKKMQADGVNVKLQFSYIPWDVWEQKVNLLLSTGEEFDLIHTMENGYPNTSSLVGKGAIVQLDELIDKYGENIKNVVPDYCWTQATMNGKIYSIPANWIEQANVLGWISVRKDLLDKYNLEIPKTLDELISTAETLQKELPEKYYCTIHGLSIINGFLFRTFASYPFYLKDGEEIAMIDKDGNVKSWLESEEFKKQCEFFRKLYTKGLISPDILSMKNDDITNLKNNGKFLFHLERMFSTIPTLKANVPEAELTGFMLNPEKGTIRMNAFLNCNTVPSSSQHPEAAIKFLNWAYGSQENMDLLVLGEKDKYWKDAGEKRYQPVKETDPDYSFDWWQIGDIKFQRFPTNASEEQIKYEGTPAENAQNFIGMGFNFDSTPVKVEYANCIAEMQNSIYPLKFGVVDYDKEFAGALKRMKAAGLDKIIEEYGRQFSEFMKSKGK